MSAFLVLRWLSLLLDASVKSVLLLGAAGVSQLLLRRASAASRHLVWRLAIGSLLALPLLSAALPAWQVRAWPHYLPGIPAVISGQWLAARPPLVLLPPLPAPISAAPHPLHLPAAPTARLRPARWADGTDPKSGPRRPAAVRISFACSGGLRLSAAIRQTLLPGRPDDSPLGPMPQAVRWLRGWAPSPVGLFWIWLAGVAVVVAPVLTGLARVRSIAGRSRRVNETPLASLTDQLSRSPGLRFRVTVLVAGAETEPVAPMTWGWRRPVVLLPAESQAWPEERLRAVLLHELAHVRRRDWPVQMLAHAALALYWFHPIVWLAVRQLRFESERACDDHVLAMGVRATDYAAHLLAIVRSLRGSERPLQAALTLVPRPPIEGRLRAILDSRHDRRDAPRWTILPAAVVFLGVVIPLAAVRPAGQRPPDRRAGETIRAALIGRRERMRPIPEGVFSVRVAILERTERPLVSQRPSHPPVTHAPRIEVHERPIAPRRELAPRPTPPAGLPPRRPSRPGRFVASLPEVEPSAAALPVLAPATQPVQGPAAAPSTAPPATGNIPTELAALPEPDAAADGADPVSASPPLTLVSNQTSGQPEVSEAASSPDEAAGVSFADQTETASDEAPAPHEPEPDTDVLPATGQDRDALPAPPPEALTTAATEPPALPLGGRDAEFKSAFLKLQPGQDRLRAAELLVWDSVLQQWDRYLVVWEEPPAVSASEEPEAEPQEPAMSAPAALSGPGSMDEELWRWDQLFEDEEQEPADEREPAASSDGRSRALPSPV